RHALVVQAGRYRHSKTVRGKLCPKSCPRGMSSHHAANVVSCHGTLRELSGASRRCSEKIDGVKILPFLVSLASLVIDSGRVQVHVKKNFQVMSNWNFSALASLLIKVKHPLVTSLVVVLTL